MHRKPGKVILHRVDKCFNCKWTTGNKCPLLAALVSDAVDFLYAECIIRVCAMHDPILTEVTSSKE